MDGDSTVSSPSGGGGSKIEINWVGGSATFFFLHRVPFIIMGYNVLRSRILRVQGTVPVLLL